MRVTTLKLQNFRGYIGQTSINFSNFTAFVGKNDVGKSTILDALDIFFNGQKAISKFEKSDINVAAMAEGTPEISISVCFDNLPIHVVIDATNNTTLQNEYLLNTEGQLEIKKVYSPSGSEKVYIHAYHPTNPSCSNLLQKKDNELRRILEAENIECEDRTRNAVMRSSIWNHYAGNLQLAEVDIDVSKNDAKNIWDKLQPYLPIYSLFQSDRKNSDEDNEVQDPLKQAVKEILCDEELSHTLNSVAEVVEQKLREVSERTLTKLREMDDRIADSLNPVIPSGNQLKWADVFKKVSITGDNDIPINKRGSGVKRLVLLNFFRAEAERRLEESNAPNIIYAIEEPETSQHAENQKKLINALKVLSESPNTQIIITTHSATIVKGLSFDDVRIVMPEDGHVVIRNVETHQLPYPSLNEINYLAFDAVSEEYHNELYGYIDSQRELDHYKEGQHTLTYVKLRRDGTQATSQIVLSEYIRHQIHHPENTLNAHYTDAQLRESLLMMRNFLSGLHNTL